MQPRPREPTTSSAAPADSAASQCAGSPQTSLGVMSTAGNRRRHCASAPSSARRSATWDAIQSSPSAPMSAGGRGVQACRAVSPTPRCAAACSAKPIAGLEKIRAVDPDHDLGSRRAGGDLVQRGDHHHRAPGVCGDRDTDRAGKGTAHAALATTAQDDQTGPLAEDRRYRTAQHQAGGHLDLGCDELGPSRRLLEDGRGAGAGYE